MSGRRTQRFFTFLFVVGLTVSLLPTACGGGDNDQQTPPDLGLADGDTVAAAETDVPIADSDTTIGDNEIAARPDIMPDGEIVAPASLALLAAFSAEGTTVRAAFSSAVDPTSATFEHFSIEDGNGMAGPTVVAADVQGEAVVVTLAEPLTAGSEWQLVAESVVAQAGGTLDPNPARATIHGTLYLALIWHQHQPVYVDPQGDFLRGPWVRKHATKDYYDMAGMLAQHPDIHVMINLTPVLLRQLQEYYIDRLAPFVDQAAGTVDTEGYFGQFGPDRATPRTDPWIDLLLSPTPEPADLTDEEKGWFYRDIWSDFSISDVMLARFPEYAFLRDKRDLGEHLLTHNDLLQLKGWFELAWFDPDFLRGPVELPDSQVVDLSDLVTEDENGAFRQTAPFTEEICQRLVVEDFKVMNNVVAVHRQLMYDADTRTGQIEVMTTPFYHPILPLLYDTDLAVQAMPMTTLPFHRFQHPEDATAHVQKATQLFESQFGRPVTGMWPAEGSVAEAVVPIFQANGVRWIATDRHVLAQSTPPDQPIYTPYRIDADTAVGDDDASDAMAIVFRDTELSDKIGFFYQQKTAAENLFDFVANLRRHAPSYGQERLLTVILDGENAWEWYSVDNDAKQFLHGMYSALEAAQQIGEFRTTAVSEYLSGNAARHIPEHPIAQLPELEPLFAGSWIEGSYSTWIGEEEENLAWGYLWQVRNDLEQFATMGLARPAVDEPEPAADTPEWYAYKAWETMYAAEGSDWFWWYGSDQTAVGGDAPFDRIFRELLSSVYRYAQLAGLPVEIPAFAPVLRRCDRPVGDVLSANPIVDGQFDPDDGNDPYGENEWTAAGSAVCMDPDSPGQPTPEDDFATVYWGTTADALYVALRLNEPVAPKLGTDYQVRFYFSQKHIVSVEDENFEQDPFLAETRTGDSIAFTAGGAAYAVTIDFSGTTPRGLLSSPQGDTWGQPMLSDEISVAAGTGPANDVLETRIPLSLLHFQNDDPLEMLIAAIDGTVEVDRLPNLNALVVFFDRSRLINVTFILDATGTKLPLNAIKLIDNPVPPAGTGTAFIVGNQNAMGNWTPNQVAMADDGQTYGDEVAGDNFWTFQMLVPPMTVVEYKYTIGSLGDGWVPTEEYPLTNRGFITDDPNGDRKMILRDVFADRPDPSGILGPMTEILND